jgi:tripartite-type tricarboxylate transporter receptor subunit TctC
MRIEATKTGRMELHDLIGTAMGPLPVVFISTVGSDGTYFTWVSSIRGMLAPPKLPSTIKEVLEKAVGKAVVEPGFREWAKNAGVNVVSMSSTEYKNNTEEQHAIVEKFIHLLK